MNITNPDETVKCGRNTSISFNIEFLENVAKLLGKFLGVQRTIGNTLRSWKTKLIFTVQNVDLLKNGFRHSSNQQSCSSAYSYISARGPTFESKLDDVDVRPTFTSQLDVGAGRTFDVDVKVGSSGVEFLDLKVRPTLNH